MKPPTTTKTPVTKTPQTTTDGDKSTDLNKIQGGEVENDKGTAMIIGPIIDVLLLIIIIIVLRKIFFEFVID